MAMPSKEYWQKRSEATLIANEKRVIQYEKELKKAYTATAKRIKTELQAFYQKYADENGLSYSGVRYRLNKGELKEFKEKQKHYLEEVEKYGADPAYKKYLKELSAKAYVTKLQEIESTIRHEIELLNGEFNKGLTNTLKDSYEDSFYRTMFDVQKNMGFGVSFTKLGEKDLIKAIETPWLASSYSNRIWTNKNKLTATLNQLIPQEFVRGRGVRDVAKDIEQRLGVSYSNAVRLARTELNYVSNQGSLDAYKESGVVEQYQFSATLDNRTSEICQDLDGKVVDLSEAEVGVNLPPMHPHCRSTTIPYFPDDEFGSYIEDRVARGADGKTYKVGKNTTYKEWAEEHTSDTYVKKVKSQPKQYKQMDDDVPTTLDTNPLTLENYKQHEEEWLKQYVEPKCSKESQEAFSSLMSDVFDENCLSMRRGPRGLRDILTSERFKTQFETGSSGGALNHRSRTQVCEKLFGADTTKMKAQHFEKYGYCGRKDALYELTGGDSTGVLDWETNMMSHYGSWRIDFKKSTVMNRTTFTMTDSLGPGLHGRIIASPVIKPTLSGLERQYINNNTINEITSATNRSSYVKSPSALVDDAGGFYLELQYHGELTLKDVKEIHVTSDVAYSDIDLVKLAVDKKIPVTVYDELDSSSGNSFLDADTLQRLKDTGATIVSWKKP